ncbi:alpha-N-acetylglucosaminidase TIM-barrel domain-containing protein [Kribbella sp. NPDC056345]|uniref:alpha-N-acetylglucosaminidase n=1 Tax=Kribbella sp. NPDC056345 TaxID=3345789 RepID=UPI0035DFB549
MRRPFAALLTAAALLTSVLTTLPAQAADDGPPAVRALLERVVGKARADQVSLRLQADQAAEWFRVTAVGGRIEVSANSSPALLTGFNRYLKQVAHADVSIMGSQLPATLPLPTAPISRTSTVEHRFALNDTNEGYTGPYQSWPEWERHLDVLALNGVNEALLYVGQEAVYRETFQRFGYSDLEIRDWIPQPAHQPWWLMQNMCCFNEPVSTELLDRRVALGRQIADRMRSLGITPVFPGYFGTVPPGFSARNGGVLTVPQGTWVDGLERPDWLDPTTPVFSQVASTFYAVQKQLFGATGLYKMDLLHEGGTAGQVPIGAASRAVQVALNAAHPDARWAILGWIGNPLPQTLEAVDRSKMLILDGMSEAAEITDRETDFQQAPYAFGTIWNFGGHTNMSAALHTWNTKFHEWRRKAGSRVTGIALMPEAIENNPVAVEFFLELPWQDGPVDLDAWFAEYARARYGVADVHAQQVWKRLSETAYSTPSFWTAKEGTGFLANRPQLDARTEPLNYPVAAFDQAFAELLQVAPAARASSAYRYDLVDVGRQVLDNHSRDLLPQIAAAYHAKDLTSLRRLNAQWLELLGLLEKLLATHEDSLFGPLLADARAMAASDAEAAVLEYDTRALMTTWGERATEAHLFNYTRRLLGGLVGDFYLPRWRLFLTGLETALQQGKLAQPIDWYAIGAQWSRQRNVLPTSPVGDTYTVASELYERLAADSMLARLDVAADPVVVAPNGSGTLTAVLRNTNGFAASAQAIQLSVQTPPGVHAEPLTALSVDELTPDATFTARWRVTAPDPAALTGLVSVAARVTYGTKTGTVTGGAGLVTGAAPDASYRTFSSNYSTFAQRGSQIAIHGGGSDLWLGVEEFGTVYRPAALRHENLVSAKVLRQDDTAPWGRAGLFVRNGIGPDNFGVVNLAVTPGNGCVLSSDENGDGRFDTVRTAPGIGAPAWIRLHRGPGGFTGDCSADGVHWTRVGVVAAPGTKTTQDVGVFMTAANGGNGRTGTAVFDDLQVVPATRPPGLLPIASKGSTSVTK